MRIYHITPRENWETARAAGQYTTPSLQTEGFIHASTLQQVTGTANYLFRGQSGLALLVIEAERLNAELRFDQFPGSDQAYPHIYGPLNLEAVVEVVDFPPGDQGLFSLPAALS